MEECNYCCEKVMCMEEGCRNLATVYCSTHNKCFCQACSDRYHNSSLPNFEGHKLETLANGGKLSVKSICPKNPRCSNDWFCNRCRTFMCSNCALSEHSGHELTKVAQIVGHAKEENTATARVSKSRIDDLNRALIAIRNARAKVEENKTATEREVNDTMDKGIAALERDRARLLKDVDDSYGKYISQLGEIESVLCKSLDQTKKQYFHELRANMNANANNAAATVEHFEQVKAAHQKALSESAVVVARAKETKQMVISFVRDDIVKYVDSY